MSNTPRSGSRERRLRLVVVVGMLALSCCGQSNVVDAHLPPDARLPLDATRPPDAPDAWEWSCSIAPIPPAPSTGQQVTVVYDKAIGQAAGDGDSGAVASFPGTGDSVVVFTPRATQIVSQDAVTTTLYSAGYDPEVLLASVVPGAAGFGAIMVRQWWTSPQPADTAFCLLDPSGGYDTTRCLRLAPFDHMPSVTYDGHNYRIYLAVRNGGMHRWIINESLSVLSEQDLWDTATFGDDNVMTASSDGAEDLLAVVGWDPADPLCGTVKVHRWTAVDHTVTNLLPRDIGGGGPYFGRVANGFGLLGFGDCVDVDAAECKLLSQSQRVVLMGTYRLGGPTPRLHAIAMPDSYPTVFQDGSTTVIADQPGWHELQLSRFGADDTPEIQNVVLPLAYYGTTVELEGVYAGTALGPGDYFVVYETNAPERRAARFRIE